MGLIKKMQQGNDLLSFWPVGSIYLSVNSTNPANFFGGTWTQIRDKFLLAAGDTYAAGAEGGSASHKHTTQGHALTIAEMPAHTHGNKSLTGNANVIRWNGEGTNGTGIVSITDKNNQVNMTGSGSYGPARFNINASHEHSSVGSGSSHSHGDTGETISMPPYLAVYVWKRIA